MFPSSLGLRHAQSATQSATQSDTEAIPVLKRYSHGSTPSPKGLPQVFVCAVMSAASSPHMAYITQEPTRWTGNHEQRQLQYISGFSIAISYVHVRNTVKRYRELWTTIPMSMSLNAPSHILSSACCSYCIVVWLDLCYQICMKGASEKNATAWC